MNLTKPQELIYSMEKYTGGAIAVICGSILLHGEKPVDELQRAANALYRMNDALRLRMREDDGEVAQTAAEFAPQTFAVLSFQSRAALAAYAADYAKIPLDFHGSLCEMQIVQLPGQCGLLVKLHHIVGDAWTMTLLGTQFGRLLRGETVEAYSYADYAASEGAYLQSKRYEKDKAYFVEAFQRCDTPIYLCDKQGEGVQARRKDFVLDVWQTAAIKAYAQAKETSAFMLFMAAFSAYMSRMKMNAEKFYIGTAVLNRSGAKEQNTAGMFINTVPMLIELDYQKSFAENLASVEASALAAFKHQKCNYGDVLKTIRRSFGFSGKLYDVILSYQNAAVAGDGVETAWYHSGMQSESLQIHIDDRDRAGIFHICYDYLLDKFTEAEIEGLHRHFCNLLFSAIADDTKRLFAPDVLTSAERQRLLCDFNDTAADYPREKCVHRLFEEQAARTPDKTAVVACDATLTYAELNAMANRIAHALIKKGIGIGDIVAFALPRRSSLVAVVLGILKAGAAYMPIDPDYPQDRIDYMRTDSQARLCITADSVSELLQCTDTSNPDVPMTGESLCYCIYTSGSTGRPKGALIRHRNLVNFACDAPRNNLQNAIRETCSTVLACGSVTFDISNFEIILSLLLGKTTVFANEAELTNPRLLADLLRKNNVDCVHCTPTKLHAYLADAAFANAFHTVKCVMVGGEALSEKVRDAIRAHADTRIFNGYGPTETTMGVSFGEVEQNDITIGRPIANTQIYIVDKYMQPTPIGVTGELCIAGDGVGAGYLNRPALTAEKFADNPFGKGKLYKTGDLAYWRADGNIAYVGRNDFQVKIRGLRIELGEIESAICGVAGISQAVVVVRQNDEGRQYICAFYTGEAVDAKVIRAEIGKTLPKYMLPHSFTHLAAMPLTASGKTDRRALPAVDFASLTRDAETTPPENAQQKLLCGLMEAVLGTAPIGITDDFFACGGDSLKAIEFVSKAHNEGIYFTLQNVFDCPTVRALCDCIERGDKESVSFADADFAGANGVLRQNEIRYMRTPAPCAVGNVLLTGATGYLGAHILADFLAQDGGIAYCPVRGKDTADSTRRLREVLHFYFDGKYDDMARIEVICADLQKEKFGLAEAAYTRLLDEVDTVINCAASVKHYGSYKYFREANVETVLRLIAFCRARGAKLLHTSTLSVSGNSFADAFTGFVSKEEKHFYESSLYIGQPLDNVYVRSKFEAEKAVLDAMADGLPANILRMGNLTSRRSDGRFQINYATNAFLQRVRGVLELGVFPDYLIRDTMYAEFTPVDEAARAVMTIARHFSTAQTVFHINSTKTVPFDRLLAFFRALGRDVKIVDGDTFTAALRRSADAAGTAHIFETFINDMDTDDRLRYDSNIRIENEFTVAYLHRLGFDWADIGIDYLRQYLDYLTQIGYLPPVPQTEENGK